MISETKKEEIRKEAKAILDRFAGALEGVEIVKGKKLKKGVGGFREEENEGECSEEFRDKMFENSPKKEGDCIIAEKKKW